MNSLGRSLLKYDKDKKKKTKKKNTKSWLKIKMADFPLYLGYGAETFSLLFKSLGCYMCLRFHTCKWNVPWGLLCLNFVAGTIEPICHTQAKDLHQIQCFTILMCAPNVVSFQTSLALQKQLPVSNCCDYRRGNTGPKCRQDKVELMRTKGLFNSDLLVDRQAGRQPGRQVLGGRQGSAKWTGKKSKWTHRKGVQGNTKN